MNNQLQRFHRYALTRAIWPLVAIFGLFFLFNIIWWFLGNTTWWGIVPPLPSLLVVTAAFFYIEEKIRLELWRIAYPELDFSGTWSGYTSYEKQEVTDTPNATTFDSFRKNHRIRFKQDCLNVAVDYDKTGDYTGWNSTVATLVQDVNKVGLRYAYEVTYDKGAKSDPRLPGCSIGIEQVFVVGHTEGKKPTHITGTFVHTADGPRPRYSGRVEFKRKLVEPKLNLWERVMHWVVNNYLKPRA